MKTYHPDILRPGLAAIFCGINPAASAARDGSNFSSPTNRFWEVVFRAGFTTVRLRPEEQARLLDYGYGMTAVVERPTAEASQLSRDEFRKARAGFESKIERYAPHATVFLGKSAYQAMMNLKRVDWGRQSAAIGRTLTWVLPNPSGRNRAFSLDALVKAYTELRDALPRDVGQ